ncbi:MAG TPA: alpha/beta hydrolase [Caulobacteraceae bacterium]|nr:alpha/beta hydrolase [Caulobacteraceae bacterium]
MIKLARGLLAAFTLALIAWSGAAAAREESALARATDAYARQDPAALRALLERPDDVASLRAADPSTIAELRLALARGSAPPAARIADYRGALAELERLHGPAAPELVDLLRELAALLEAQGDRDGAEAALRRALEIAAATLGSDHATTRALADDHARALARYNARRPRTATARAAPDLTPDAPATAFELVEIWYATHRAATGDKEPSRHFGPNRAPLGFGKAVVSVPKDRQAGELPTPNLLHLEFRPDPARHVILTAVNPLSGRDAFFADLRARLGRSQRKEAFVYVHGFNNGFAGAAARTAQLAVDLSIDGTPILYSWPSKGSLLAYAADAREAEVDAQVEDLAGFLAQVAADTGAESVHLIAHSMGNRFLTRALTKLAARNAGAQPPFDEVVMAAPDVGVDEFERAWAAIRPLGNRFTLYASRRDKALQISAALNGVPRLGDSRAPVIRPGLETVDTTAASGGLLGHSDFAGTALDDFRGVVWASLAPDKRCVLQTRPLGEERFWAFDPAGSACSDREFRRVMTLVRTEGSPEAAAARLASELQTAAPQAPERSELAVLLDRLAAMFGLAAR